jgi:hypothetical protein
MHAVVTTGGYLVLVNLETRAVAPLEGRSPSYYGVSWFAGSPDLVVANSRLDPMDLQLSDYPRSEVGGVSIGARSSAPFLSAPHQLLCLSDGRIACTNTGRNCITVFDPAKPNLFQEARISAARWDRLPDHPAMGDHLNSLFEHDGMLHVLAHGFAKGSAIATFSLPDLALVNVEPTPGRTGLHNIWLTEDGRRISCHSGRGTVVDLASNEILWEAGKPVFTRGLAATADIVIVGESETFVRHSRPASHSGLWILDRRSWRALDYISLGPYGGVNEVRLLDVPDQAHHGHVFAGLADLLMRDRRHEITSERLQVASEAFEARALWRGYDQVMGAYSVRGGERVASADALCLAVKNDRSDPHALDFSYSLAQAPSQAHVSAVVGYRGNGGDTNMTALLLQASGDASARLTVWRENGAGWISDPDIQIENLPLSAHVHVSRSERGVVLSIDRDRLLELAADDYDVDGPLGIRWFGCSVRPRAS